MHTSAAGSFALRATGDGAFGEQAPAERAARLPGQRRVEVLQRRVEQRHGLRRAAGLHERAARRAGVQRAVGERERAVPRSSCAGELPRAVDPPVARGKLRGHGAAPRNPPRGQLRIADERQLGPRLVLEAEVRELQRDHQARLRQRTGATGPLERGDERAQARERLFGPSRRPIRGGQRECHELAQAERVVDRQLLVRAAAGGDRSVAAFGREEREHAAVVLERLQPVRSGVSERARRERVGLVGEAADAQVHRHEHRDARRDESRRVLQPVAEAAQVEQLAAVLRRDFGDERKARLPHALRVARASEPRLGRAQQRSRFARTALGEREPPAEQLRARTLAHRRRQPLDPGPRGLRGRRQDRRAEARDLVERCIPGSGVQPVVDGLQRAACGSELRRQRGLPRPQLLGGQGLAQVLQQGGPHERVQTERPAAGGLADEHAGVDEAAPEVGGQVERAAGGRVDRVGERGPAQRGGGAGVECREDLLREKRECGGDGLPVRRTDAQRDAERPAVCGVEHRLDLRVVGRVPGARAQQLSGRGGVEREVGPPEGRAAAGRREPGGAQRERPAAEDGDAEATAGRRHQRVEHRERVRGTRERLGVVDHDDERLDEHRLQCAQEAAERGGEVDGVPGRRGGLGERAERGADRRCDRVRQCQQQPAGVAFVSGAVQPRDRPGSCSDRLTNREGLTGAGLGGHDGDARADRGRDAGSELRPRDDRRRPRRRSTAGDGRNPRWRSDTHGPFDRRLETSAPMVRNLPGWERERANSPVAVERPLSGDA